jgi:hypothetical protein
MTGATEMASIAQMHLCKEIFELAMLVTAQGGSSLHAQYSAHVDSFCVYKTEQPEGWSYNDHWIYLGEYPASGNDPISELKKLKDTVTALLVRDADGVPV